MQVLSRQYLSKFAAGLVMAAIATTTVATSSAATGQRAYHDKLQNGLEVVVIPDHRAPVVTHMIWYRVGAADEPIGRSGIAHFLEHLMFKGTNEIPSGAFSKIIARNGGQDNAFTAQDVTTYFQRVSKDRLPLVMKMEADRMENLRLTTKDVTTERDVIIEERRSRVDSNPSSMLSEEMMSALYHSHPYGIPIIGWKHEMAKLSRDDALAFYRRYYAPSNAILVVAGDVEPKEVMALAKETYGKIAADTSTKRDPRPGEPPHRAPRRLTLADEQVGKLSMQRVYLAPSYATAKSGEAEALDLLMKIVGGGATSRLYKELVVKQQIASNAGGWYGGSGLDSTRIGIYAVAADGVSLEDVERGSDAVLAKVLEEGVTVDELERAKKSYISDYVYGNDSQSTLARRYGWALATGQSIADVEDWPERLAKVTVMDVTEVARKYLDLRSSVTGYLVPKSLSAEAEDRPPSDDEASKS